MMTTSPVRKRIGMGSVSRVRPPIRNIAALPRLHGQLISISIIDDKLTILILMATSSRLLIGQRVPLGCPENESA